MKRREMLATAGSASLIGLAGCSTVSGTIRMPNVDEDLLKEGGWKKLREDTNKILEKDTSFGTVTATAATQLYEDRALRTDLRQDTLGRVDQQVSVFFASRVAVDPTLKDVPDTFADTLLDQASGKVADLFEQRLSGTVSDIQQKDVDEDLDIDSGATADLVKYTATVELPEFSYRLTEDNSVTVDGGTLDIEGYHAAWLHNGAVYVAGGIYPGENYKREVTEELSDAISVSANINLGFTPDKYKDELFGLVKSTN